MTSKRYSAGASKTFGAGSVRSLTRHGLPKARGSNPLASRAWEDVRGVGRLGQNQTNLGSDRMTVDYLDLTGTPDDGPYIPRGRTSDDGRMFCASWYGNDGTNYTIGCFPDGPPGELMMMVCPFGLPTPISLICAAPERFAPMPTDAAGCVEWAKVFIQRVRDEQT